MSALAAIVADLAPQVMRALVDVVERDPKLAARLRALLAPHAAEPARFLSRGRYAERVDLAKRTVDALLSRGLPHVGRGRLLRIDVVAADAWLAAHLGEDDPSDDQGDEVEQLAVANARRGAA